MYSNNDKKSDKFTFYIAFKIFDQIKNRLLILNETEKQRVQISKDSLSILRKGTM